VPLAWVGGLVASIGIGGLLALALGRATREIEPPSPPEEDDGWPSDRVFMTFVVLVLVDGLIAAAAYGGRVGWSVFWWSLAVTATVGGIVWLVDERREEHLPASDDGTAPRLPTGGIPPYRRS
jgi:hypothetical protein